MRATTFIVLVSCIACGDDGGAPSDAGTLDADVRRVLVQLLRRKFLLAEKNPAQGRTLL